LTIKLTFRVSAPPVRFPRPAGPIRLGKFATSLSTCATLSRTCSLHASPHQACVHCLTSFSCQRTTPPIAGGGPAPGGGLIRRGARSTRDKKPGDERRAHPSSSSMRRTNSMLDSL